MPDGTACSPAFAATWDDFISAGMTLGPTRGVREAWHQGRTAYAVWVLRVGGAALEERVAQVQARLADAIRPVAAEDLHVTVRVAGFPSPSPARADDVAETVLEAQAGAAPRRAVPLRVGGANAFRTAAFLEVADPGGALAALRADMDRHGREIRFAPYLPHVTVGTFLRDQPTAPLTAALADLRRLPPLELVIRTLELVVFDPATPGAPLRTSRAIPLEHN